MNAGEYWLERFRADAPALPGAGLPWLARIRGEAIERFEVEGWPTTRREEWRHTSLAVLDSLRFFAPSPHGAAERLAAARALLERLRAEDLGHWLVFVDGEFVESLSAIGALPRGVALMSMRQALERRQDEVQALFGEAADGASPCALNAAFTADGAFVSIPDGGSVDDPVHLVFIVCAAGVASHARNLIAVGAQAHLTVVEHHLGCGESVGSDGAPPTLTNVVTRIVAGRGARVQHLKLQQESTQALHLATIDAVQEESSHFAAHSLSFGARLARNDVGTRFAGEHCEALLNGLYHVDGRRHVDHHTRIDHGRPRCTSREYYRGILDGTARGVFSGRIVVAPGAARSDALQRTDSLLLSPMAEADARPELEIYADDVKCAHGATVGRLDEAGLFYLRSRGIDEARARSLLVWAFAAQALDRITLAPLRRSARRSMLERLPGGRGLEDLLEGMQ